MIPKGGKRQEANKEEKERRVGLPGGEVLINAQRQTLLELVISSGLQVIEACVPVGYEDHLWSPLSTQDGPRGLPFPPRHLERRP
jgi:hypothetical protein